MGTNFTYDKDGFPDLRYWWTKKRLKTVYAGIKTGKQIITDLNTQARKYK